MLETKLRDVENRLQARDEEVARLEAKGQELAGMLQTTEVTHSEDRERLKATHTLNQERIKTRLDAKLQEAEGSARDSKMLTEQLTQEVQEAQARIVELEQALEASTVSPANFNTILAVLNDLSQQVEQSGHIASRVGQAVERQRTLTTERVEERTLAVRLALTLTVMPGDGHPRVAAGCHRGTPHTQHPTSDTQHDSSISLCTYRGADRPDTMRGITGGRRGVTSGRRGRGSNVIRAASRGRGGGGALTPAPTLTIPQTRTAPTAYHPHPYPHPNARSCPKPRGRSTLCCTSWSPRIAKWRQTAQWTQMMQGVNRMF